MAGSLLRTHDCTKPHCCKTAVHTTKVNFMKYGNYKDRKRSGRPQKSTPRDDSMMKRMVAPLVVAKNKGVFESERFSG